MVTEPRSRVKIIVLPFVMIAACGSAQKSAVPCTNDSYCLQGRKCIAGRCQNSSSESTDFVKQPSGHLDATSDTADSAKDANNSAVACKAPPLLVGAGDIANEGDNDELTAQLLDSIFPVGALDCVGAIFTAGDNVYDNGTPEEFAKYYEPTWGRHKARTRPAPGNHDYNTKDASGYYSYFGAAAGAATQGYYSYDLGAWHIAVLNSNCKSIGGCNAGSPQEQWLRADLEASKSLCQAAYWHHARFSSSSHHGDQVEVQALWRALYDHGVDIAIVGHDHDYERFAPMDADGNASAVGVREFVVGTGGAPLTPFGPLHKTSEAHSDSSAGVLKLTLKESSYDWEFIPTTSGAFTDSGSTTCH